MCIVATCTGVYPKNIALGQVVTTIVGQVDTVWETKQVYTRITLKSKDVTNHRVNRWNSLKVNLRSLKRILSLHILRKMDFELKL